MNLSGPFSPALTALSATALTARSTPALTAPSATALTALSATALTAPSATALTALSATALTARSTPALRAPVILALLALAASGPRAEAQPARAEAQPARRIILAQRAHLGDGRVIAPARVHVDAGLVTWVGDPAGAPRVEGAEEITTCSDLLPGLVTGWQLPGPPDRASVDPSRLAAESFPGRTAWDVLGDDDEGLRARGILALAVAPGPARLVGGRMGLLRLLGEGQWRGAPLAGSLAASLAADALSPPDLFEPVLRVNADNPLPAARPQRPHSPMAASAELRRLLASQEPPWEDVRRGSVPLAIHARSQAEIRRAMALARESAARLVILGGDESWKLAEELGALQALVVLDETSPREALAQRLDLRADSPALLHAAGVAVALAGDQADPPDPLFLAALAVRRGLPREQALAAVTGRLARAAGAPELRIAERMPADLVGFDGDPLSASSRPAFVLASGHLLEPDARDHRGLGPDDDADDDSLIALRVGSAGFGPGVVEDATILVRGKLIASVGQGQALPASARLLDFGAGSVAVPGFIDAYSLMGLDPGASPAGTTRRRAHEALEPGHASLQQALQAGMTSALAAPDARGSVLGLASIIGLHSRTERPPRDADAPEDEVAGRPVIDVLAADAGIVLLLDEGSSDDGARQSRLRSLREALQKAKSYNEAWTRSEKKPDKPAAGGRGGGRPASSKKSRASGEGDENDKPEKDPALEPWRAVFAGKAKVFLRAGREDLILPGLDAFKGVGLTPVLCGAEEASHVARELKARGVTVILRPSAGRFRPDEPPVAATLRAAGVPVAFGSFEPGEAAALPARVAALVRGGLAPGDALDGLTRTAAAAIGLEGAGDLAPGSRADVVVFDGDPMEPSSRVLAVLARGRLVFRQESP